MLPVTFIMKQNKLHLHPEDFCFSLELLFKLVLYAQTRVRQYRVQTSDIGRRKQTKKMSEKFAQEKKLHMVLGQAVQNRDENTSPHKNEENTLRTFAPGDGAESRGSDGCQPTSPSAECQRI